MVLILLVLGIFAALFFLLGLHRRPNFIHNFEADVYGREQRFMEPTTVADGLAVYTRGSGAPVLLFPYPHGHTTKPMAQGPIATILVNLGQMVVSFDVPGAFRSTRVPVGNMQEMIQAADETLERLGILGPVDVVGHSMGGLAALGYAIERPQRTKRLVLANSFSGFPAAARCGFPGSAFSPLEADYWRIIIWGMRLASGRANLAVHKKLYNLMGRASLYDKARFTALEIDEQDQMKGVPIRMIWSRNMYSRLSYANRLAEVRAPVLIIAGRHDPQAALPCSEALQRGIANARLVIFEKSGHAPFIEEAPQFTAVLEAFLNEDERR